MRALKLSTNWKPAACSMLAGLFMWVHAADAPASVILGDDAHFGSNSVIRDLDNDLDFLQLVFTMGYSYNGVVAQLGAGGDFHGWSVASIAQLGALTVSASLVAGSTDPAEIAEAEQLRDWFCVRGAVSCVNLSTTHEYARGLVADPNPEPSGTQRAFAFGRRFNVSPEEAFIDDRGWRGPTVVEEEVFLVRSALAVPEPQTYALLLAGLGLLGFAARRACGDWQPRRRRKPRNPRPASINA